MTASDFLKIISAVGKTVSELIPIPKTTVDKSNGINAVCRRWTSLPYGSMLSSLANKDAIPIIHYLGSCYRNRLQSLDFISKQVNIPVNRVKKIMDNLDRLGIVRRVSADISDSPTIIYGYGHNTPLTCLLILVKSISRYDLYIDMYTRGPFRYKAVTESTPVPDVSSWDNESNLSKEE